jgi:quercetin dioxygenase-like cupin family protein
MAQSSKLETAAAGPPRRVVAGLDADERSCILFDGLSQTVIWSTNTFPADNSGADDRGSNRIPFDNGGVNFVFAELKPGATPYMHSTNSIDYVVVLSGEVVFMTETGETRLQAGDVLVDRGVLHAWRNDTDQPCRFVSIVSPARPVGKGATLTGNLDQATIDAHVKSRQQ